MRVTDGRSGSRRRIVLTAGVVLGLILPALASAAALAGTSAPAAAGAQLWVSQYNGPANSYDGAVAEAVSPTDGTVFVTGPSDAANGDADYATAAYDPASGDQLWVARYDGPGDGFDTPTAIAVSPDGGTVFVTGYSAGTDALDYATIAYNATTGAELWIQRYAGARQGPSEAKALVVSHDGSTVYVTGYGASAKSVNAYVTLAYNAATGARLWSSRYNGSSNNQARSMAISPNDKTIYVSGRSGSSAFNYDDATVAYNAVTGAQLWVTRFASPYNSKASGSEYVNDITAGPGGKTVYITGGSAGQTSRTDFTTIAYKASTGAQLWISRYNGPGNFTDFGFALAVTPNGSTVVATGSSWGTGTNYDYATIAYNASTGATRWIKRYSGVPGGYDGDNPAGLVISRDGATAYVTGTSESVSTETDYATVAYSVATGARLWVSRYDGPDHSFDGANALALSPSGNALYVTGGDTGIASKSDFGTVAYQT
jgi:DNA-binding beta-propeller fold protein YncE